VAVVALVQQTTVRVYRLLALQAVVLPEVAWL
jgi:hypothetical protein